MPASSTTSTWPRRRACSRGSCKSRSIVRACPKPTRASSSTAERVGATATISRPPSATPRCSSCKVAVLPVPAAPRRFTARSRESSTTSTACFCSGRSRSDTVNSAAPPRRGYWPCPWLMAATICRSRARLSAVATSRPAFKTVPACSSRRAAVFSSARSSRPRPCCRASRFSSCSAATETRSKTCSRA